MPLSSVGYQTITPQPGTASAPGSYIPVTGVNANYLGITQYTNGVDFIAYNGTTWYLGPAPNLASAPFYATSNGSSTSFPLTGWGVAAGTAPVPTFALISGAVVSSIQPRVVIF